MFRKSLPVALCLGLVSVATEASWHNNNNNNNNDPWPGNRRQAHPAPAAVPNRQAANVLPADFDVNAYLRLNPDLTRASQRLNAEQRIIFARQHFLDNGRREGRVYYLAPLQFDAMTYINRHPDLIEATRHMNNAAKIAHATDHYKTRGRVEGRVFIDAPAGFDPITYLYLHPDLLAAAPENRIDRIVFAQNHYRFNGNREGRRFAHMVNNQPMVLPADFDPILYVLRHPDLVQAAPGNRQQRAIFAAKHYLEFGIREGRAYTDAPVAVEGRPVAVGLDLDDETRLLLEVFLEEEARELAAQAEQQRIELLNLAQNNESYYANMVQLPNGADPLVTAIGVLNGRYRPTPAQVDQAFAEVCAFIVASQRNAALNQQFRRVGNGIHPACLDERENALIALYKPAPVYRNPNINNVAELKFMLAQIWYEINHYQDLLSPERTAVTKEIMKQTLIKNLGQCVEDAGHVVCGPGKTRRMLTILQGHVPGIIIDQAERPATDTFWGFFNQELYKQLEENNEDLFELIYCISRPATLTDAQMNTGLANIRLEFMNRINSVYPQGSDEIAVLQRRMDEAIARWRAVR